MQLRPYQTAAVEAVYEHLRSKENNPCVVLPTGTGKAVLLAQIAKDAAMQWNGRVLILAHVKELLEQNADKIRRLAPELKIGVYSAGLNRRDTEEQVIVADIQSVYNKACELGSFDLIIVDEAHLIASDGDGMYRTFLKDAKIINPNVRLIGLTATPFRLKGGIICKPENLLNEICFEAGLKEMILQGYLSPLVSKAGRTEAKLNDLHIRAGEFIARFKGEHVPADLFGTPKPPLKFLANVNVLTTGFDCPNTDCVVLLRPTNSAGLLIQMVGRGTRLCNDKSNCLVLDYGGNILRHGPIDMIDVKDRTPGNGDAPAKKCPECLALIHAAYQKCPECGHEFPPPEHKEITQNASTAGVISGQIDYTDYEVMEAFYAVHEKRGADSGTPKTVRIDYRIGFNEFKSEWICPEHSGYARDKFVKWWRERAAIGVAIPATAREAVALANEGVLAEPESITVKTVAGEKFERISGWRLKQRPTLPEGYPFITNDDLQNADTEIDDDDIPF